MEEPMICQKCFKKKATQKHHLLSQTMSYAYLYPEFIHDERNIMHLCHDCHLSKSLKKLTELEFCMMLKIKPRSKTLLNKIMQGKLERFWNE
jgi:hypothetical protein